MAYSILVMYHQARGFQLAAERCLETREHPEQTELPIQAIVNITFACEVYLKAIYAFENPYADKLRGHNLRKLYAQLSEDNRTAIEDRLSDLYTKEGISQYLETFGNIFEEYRYIYEIKSDDRTHFGFLHFFVGALQDVVGELTHRYVFRLAGLEDKS